MVGTRPGGPAPVGGLRCYRHGGRAADDPLPPGLRRHGLGRGPRVDPRGARRGGPAPDLGQLRPANGLEPFGQGTRFAIVDFHFHPGAEYWFDHHPTTFLDEDLRAAWSPSERWMWDETSPSCLPHDGPRRASWGYEVPERFREMARWSDVVDAARYESVDQAIYGERRRPADHTRPPGRSSARLDRRAGGGHAGRDPRGRRLALGRGARLPACVQDEGQGPGAVPPTVVRNRAGVVLYDASSGKVRRALRALLPPSRRALRRGRDPVPRGLPRHGGENPWNPPTHRMHVGELMERCAEAAGTSPWAAPTRTSSRRPARWRPRWSMPSSSTSRPTERPRPWSLGRPCSRCRRTSWPSASPLHRRAQVPRAGGAPRGPRARGARLRRDDELAGVPARGARGRAAHPLRSGAPADRGQRPHHQAR